jgi:ankyrin repeat protein
MKTQKILMVLVLWLAFVSAGCNTPSDITVLRTISLHDAAVLNDIDRVKLEISKGARINLKDEHGWTALHYAAVKNLPLMTKLLIENGADINIGDKERNQTALHFAAVTEKKQAVEQLLESGANPFLEDTNNKTPKQLAELTGNKEIVDLFHKYGY